MHRAGTILLSILTVAVLAAAVWVLKDPGSKPSDAGNVVGPVPTLATGRSTPVVSVAGSGTPSASASSSGPAPSGSATATTPTVAFIGDEWTSGRGASASGLRFTSLLCAALHWREVNLGDPGAGYAVSGTGDHQPFAGQVAAAVAAAPSVVVVSGGRNDANGSITTAAADAGTLFATLHAQLPQARLVALPPFWGDSSYPAAMSQLRTAVRQAVTAVGGTFVDIPDPIGGHPDFMADDAVPDDAGYAAIAAALRAPLAAVATG